MARHCINLCQFYDNVRDAHRVVSRLRGEIALVERYIEELSFKPEDIVRGAEFTTGDDEPRTVIACTGDRYAMIDGNHTITLGSGYGDGILGMSKKDLIDAMNRLGYKKVV